MRVTMNTRSSRARWLTSFGALFLLVLTACASSATAPRETATAAPTERTSDPEEPAPAQLSAYEQRWQTACTDADAAASSQCPAPFDRPGVFVETQGTGDLAPPSLCDLGAQAPDPDAVAALAKKQKALRSCFRGARVAAWVEVSTDPAQTPAAASGLAPRAIDCVTKIVRSALPHTGPESVKRVVVLHSGGSGRKQPTLSKESVHAMITSHADEISACYDGALEVWPGLRGRHATRVVVWFDGSVALVRTQESSLHNPALECCINTAVRGFRFAAPEDGNIVLVTLPFALGPTD